MNKAMYPKYVDALKNCHARPHEDHEKFHPIGLLYLRLRVFRACRSNIVVGEIERWEYKESLPLKKVAIRRPHP